MNNRKPDALPVEGASIAEALEALDSFGVRDLDEPGMDSIVRSALERAAAEGEATKALVESLGALHCELKGAQLMIFEADTPEKRSEAFKCVGAVVAFLMKAERELRLPAPPKGST
jgi:hypothetical protein